MPGESYRRQLRSLLLCLCEGFRALINSLVCWFSIWTFYFCFIQNWEDYTFELPLCNLTIYEFYLFFLKHRQYSELADSTTTECFCRCTIAYTGWSTECSAGERYSNNNNNKLTEKEVYKGLYVTTCPKLKRGNLSQPWSLTRGTFYFCVHGPQQRELIKIKKIKNGKRDIYNPGLVSYTHETRSGLCLKKRRFILNFYIYVRQAPAP